MDVVLIRPLGFRFIVFIDFVSLSFIYLLFLWGDWLFFYDQSLSQVSD